MALHNLTTGKTDAEWRRDVAAKVARALEDLPPGLSLEAARSKLASGNTWRGVRGYRPIVKMYDAAADEAAKLYRWQQANGGR